MKLLYKIQITGTLTLETGMHIGGSEVDLDIGGIDSAVAKDKKSGRAYIPGSSLKGKLRDLVARAKGYRTIRDDKDETLTLFGKGADKSGRNFGHLIVRDSFNRIDENQDQFEDKAENVIARDTGKATPRHIERSVKGNQFVLDMILDIYSGDIDTKLLETLRLGFRLLEHDYLGGSGTRGYGKVSIQMDPPQKILFNKDGTIDDTQTIDFDFNKRYKENESS
jgi:CRISPR-associated protein Csm3